MNQELKEELELLSGWAIPKHDVLEFLLDNLPNKLNGVNSKYRDGTLGLYATRKGIWVASYGDDDGNTVRRQKKDAPSNNTKYSWFLTMSGEDPTCPLFKLAIKLFKEGILTK